MLLNKLISQTLWGLNHLRLVFRSHGSMTLPHLTLHKLLSSQRLVSIHLKTRRTNIINICLSEHLIVGRGAVSAFSPTVWTKTRKKKERELGGRGVVEEATGRWMWKRVSGLTVRGAIDPPLCSLHLVPLSIGRRQIVLRWPVLDLWVNGLARMRQMEK